MSLIDLSIIYSVCRSVDILINTVLVVRVFICMLSVNKIFHGIKIMCKFFTLD